MKEISKMEHDNQRNEEIIDLRGTFPVHLKNGVHTLHTDPDGTKLSGTFADGKITSWQGKDKDGSNLETYTVFKNAPVKCEVCVVKPPPRGIVCYWIDCRLVN